MDLVVVDGRVLGSVGGGLMKPPLTEREARAYIVSVQTVGGVSENMLRSCFRIPKERARQICTTPPSIKDRRMITRVLQQDED